MKRATFAVLLAGLTFCVFSTSSFAQDAESGSVSSDQPAAAPVDASGHEMSAAKLKDKLGLSDDQVAKLDAAWKSAKDAAKPYRDQLKADMKKLRDQVKSKASDDDIKTTLDDIDTARKGLRDAMEKARADTRSILTPTQQAKMELHMERRFKQVRKAMHAKGGHGKPASSGGDAAPAPTPAQ